MEEKFDINLHIKFTDTFVYSVNKESIDCIENVPDEEDRKIFLEEKKRIIERIGYTEELDIYEFPDACLIDKTKFPESSAFSIRAYALYNDRVEELLKKYKQKEKIKVYLRSGVILEGCISDFYFY